MTKRKTEKKILKFLVSPGLSDCDTCPFMVLDHDQVRICGNPREDLLDCEQYDLATLQAIGVYEKDS